MNTFDFGCRAFVLAAPVLILAGCSPETTTDTARSTTTDATAKAECQASGGYEYVCGPRSAEDLVLVPSTSFIISSGFGNGAPFYLIDARDRAWSELVPAMGDSAAPLPAGDSCPGAPDLSKLVSHGLNLQPGENGHSTLYVVAHGGREAIEVFDVDATGDRPVLSWKSCVMMPEGVAANSVASRPDGSLVFSVPLQAGRTISEAMTGAPTGALYSWSPADDAIELIAGTELPYPNGVEVSADGEEIYVASSGAFTVTAYSNSNPARLLRSSAPMEIVPDNLHAAPNGTLLTAGLVVADETCGVVGGSKVFDLAEFTACPRPFMVKAIDPVTMVHETIATGPADARFSNVTMALPVGQELWIGTFSGDRIAVRPAQPE